MRESSFYQRFLQDPGFSTRREKERRLQRALSPERPPLSDRALENGSSSGNAMSQLPALRARGCSRNRERRPNQAAASPARLRVLRAASAGGVAWLPIGSSLGAWPRLRPAPQPRRVKCGSHRLRVLFIEGRGAGLFTRCHWLDLNRPDCGPAAGRGCRGPRLAPDSSCEAGPAPDEPPRQRWAAGRAGALGGCGQRGSAG